VQELLQQEAEKFTSEFQITTDDYLEVLEQAFLEMYKGTEKTPRYSKIPCA